MRSTEIAQRMVGVITKPDGVLSQDDALKMVDLASNEDLRLGLGWHVVRNLSHEELDRSRRYRDSEERKFFASGVWSRLPGKDLGIESLRHKLCQRLFESIKRDLPQLIDEMTSQLTTTRRNIDQLGRVRKNAKDCLWYLSEIKSSMHQLASAASESVYDDPNISAFFGKSDFTKLRNLITTRSNLFNREICGTGKTYVVSPDTGDHEEMDDYDSPEPVFQPPYFASRHDDGPYNITAQAYCSVLSMAMTQNRGKNLPDLPNFRDIQAVFRSQSIRWHGIARTHVESCFDDTLTFMSEAIPHVAGPYTSSRLLEEYIQPSLEKRRAVLVEKLDELLWPFAQCHPITARPKYTTMPRLLLDSTDRRQTEKNDSATMWSRHAQRYRFTVDHMHAAHVLDRAEAYYEVCSEHWMFNSEAVLTWLQIALDTFIDNVATLAIERVLLRDLPDLILSSCDPSSLTDEQLEAVAGESEEVKEQQTKAVHRVAALEAVIQTCRQYKGISRSTPQKATMSRTVATPHDATHASKAPTYYIDGTLQESSADASNDEDPVSKFESPATPQAVRSERHAEHFPSSPSSSLSSGFRSAKSSGSTSTALSSPAGSSFEQYYNTPRSVAHRPVSRSDKNKTSSARS